jgi:hypothetical protein
MTDPSMRARVRAYYDGAFGMPPTGDPGDYSAAFELALPDPQARRQYFRILLEGRSPNYGHRVLGSFAAAGLSDLVVTTNFDDLIEQAAESARAALGALGEAARSRLTVAALGYAEQAALSLGEDAFPLLVKLHGDFREAELRNIAAELQQQDAVLRRAVIDASRRFGLAVVGYSGRDDSVMHALLEAASQRGSYPAGLWWLTRDPNRLSLTVSDLLDRAAAAGTPAHVVQADNFDETMAALARQASLPAPLRTHLDAHTERPRVVDAALPDRDGAPFPVLRWNALPVLSAPTQAMAAQLADEHTPVELRQTLTDHRWQGEVVLTGRSALAFGSASHLQEALALPAAPTIATVDFLSEAATTQQRALALRALTRTLARRLPVRMRDGLHSTRLIATEPNPERPHSDERARAHAALRLAYDSPLTGVAPASLGPGRDGAPRVWAEQLQLRLEWRLNTLWLLFTPTTWVSVPAEATDTRAGRGDPASAWRKERWVNRRNEAWAAILGCWAELLAPTDPTELPAVVDTRHDDVTGGTFLLAKTTAYSRITR